MILTTFWCNHPAVYSTEARSPRRVYIGIGPLIYLQLTYQLAMINTVPVDGSSKDLLGSVVIVVCQSLIYGEITTYIYEYDVCFLTLTISARCFRGIPSNCSSVDFNFDASTHPFLHTQTLSTDLFHQPTRFRYSGKLHHGDDYIGHVSRFDSILEPFSRISSL